MKISGFENIISIEQFEYCSKVNTHERCRFICYVREKDVDTLLGLLDSDCTFEDDEFSFEGHIEEISISKDISGTKMEVSSIGKTYLSDKDLHSRIFQDPEKTLSDILSKLESMSDVKHECEQEKVIKSILIQDESSDWSFAVEMAGVLGEYVFPGEKTFIGMHGSRKASLKEEECIDYKYSLCTSGVSLFCRTASHFSLGDVVGFNDKELFIYQKKYVLEEGQYYQEYNMLEIPPEMGGIRVKNEALLEAVVKDNQDPDKKGKIQVSFAGERFEDCMAENPIWLECGSMFASRERGAIFIPSIEDRVLVKISNGKGIILGSLRTEAYSGAVRDPNAKYFIFDETVFVEYKDGCLTVNMGEKNQVVIDSQKACIQIDKSAMEIAEDLKVSVGKAILEAKSEASISARDVNIKGKSGVNIN